MKINYDKENRKYLDVIKGYREVTAKVIAKETAEQLQRKGNKKLPEETEHEVLFMDVKLNNLDWSKDPLELPNKTYSFVTFTDTKLGKTAVLSENEMYEQNATFWNVTFTNCEFQNIKFINCRFFGCKFINCKTKELGIIFEDCYFCKTTVGHNGKGEFETEMVSSQFIDCWITAKFKNCKLEYVLWENCSLILTSFNDCSLINSVFTECGFYDVVSNDSDIAGVSILKMKKADIEFYGQYADSEFHRSTYIDLMSYKNKSPRKKENSLDIKKMNREDAADLSKLYYTLVNSLHSKNGDIDFISEYKYQYQKHHMIAKEKWYLQIWDRISWALCGFGEKIFRFILWFAGIIIAFAIIYLFSGLQLPNREIQYVIIGGNPFDLMQLLKDFGLGIHFSVVTLSTVGYGNITPLGWVSTALCTLQILLGLLFVATFTSIIIKKIIRE
ncbi:ion channel [Anaerocolumna chitinilytica]|uniref:Potassium channel domain-containing protein n=1 Tax=Anaerocolumna chitinilytica TaxID=1727145 RepID=A0A7I8DNE4_9FIRM|nr:ion channel [Anaerocolumna chitinilytica]BCJ99933.1 hypothetical protein bsdcttw_29740 [Anaerocolumna chitinilytica]